MYRAVAALIAASVLGLGGCGLIDSDITDFNLSINDKTFTVDTAQWELADQSTFPEVDCSVMDVCSAAVMQSCMSDNCFGSCDGQNCQALILVSLWVEIDLLDEHPELEEIDNIVSVTINRVEYEISENTLTIDTPVMTLYVAPATVMSPGDPQAQEIGTIAPVTAGMPTTEPLEVNLTPEGRDNLREFMSQYRTPFNIIVGSEVEIMAGDPIPMGRLEANVRVTATAGL
jgi:hypothetical protein